MEYPIRFPIGCGVLKYCSCSECQARSEHILLVEEEDFPLAQEEHLLAREEYFLHAQEEDRFLVQEEDLLAQEDNILAQ